MPRTVILLMTLTVLLGAHAHTSRPSSGFDHGDLDAVLKKHVTKGRVDYGALRRDRARLDRYLGAVAKADVGRLTSKAEKTVFWINAYNAATLSLVLEHDVKESVRDVKGFFDRLRVTVAGRPLTLDEIEARARELGDPRVHFAVNCASASCPPLRNRAWAVRTLEEDLAAATRAYLADSSHGLSVLRTKRTIRLSRIFRWYAKDFAASGRTEDVLRWLAPYLPAATARWMKTHSPKVVWKTYDWSLNGRR